MSLAISPSATLVRVGRGAIYLDVLDANGARQGQYHLGNCTKLAVTQTDEKKQMYSSMSASTVLYDERNVKRTISVSITGTEFSQKNLELATMGTGITISQSANSLSNVAFANSVHQGRHYEIGKRDVANVVLRANNASKTVTTDYTVDATRGRIYVVPGGGIADITNLTIDCDYGAVSLAAVSGADVANLNAFLLFVSADSADPIQEVHLWNVALSADGELGLISDDYMNWNLKGEVKDDTANHASAPYFQKVLKA